MDEPPGFFLSSAGEYQPLSEPRGCWTRARLRDQARDDHMLIEIDPPLIGQGFGLGGKDITQLVISGRHQGDTLFPITAWPLSVYVARVLDENIVKTLSFTREQVELVAWAMIFRTLDEATAHAKKMAR
jgi:hypothetical protein